jgi:hypothetical protein
MRDQIQAFIDTLPPEFAETKRRAMHLLQVHRDDVMAAYLAGRKMWSNDTPYANAEDYYQATHGGADTGQNHPHHGE